jgi:hypothetical protein
MKKPLLALIALSLICNTTAASDIHTQYLSAELRKSQIRNYRLAEQLAQKNQKIKKQQILIEANFEFYNQEKVHQAQVLRDATLLAGTTGVITFCLGYFYLR